MRDEIKQMAADMEVVSNFLHLRGRFESDMVAISISDLADIIRGKDYYPVNKHKLIQHVNSVLTYHSDDTEFCNNYRKDIDQLIGVTQ